MAREMKDSGIEWIGKIPIDWNMGRLLWCLEEIKDKNNPIKTTNVLALTNKLGVVPYEEKGNQGNKAKEDYSQYSLAYEDTLVINSMNVLIGSVGISHYYGCVSPVYYVFKSTEKTDLRFINYIFQNVGFQKELRKYANGILEIRLRVSSHDMLRRTIPLPSKTEQERISDFLDTECSRINSVIEETRTSIEEYKKLKQAVITQAVTKGIRPDNKMKESGINWIGDIPAHWTIQRKLSYAVNKNISYGIVKLFDPDDEKGVKVLRCSDVREGQIDTTNIRTVTQDVSNEYSRTVLDGGEVLINVRGTLGGCAVVPPEMKGYNIAREVAMVSVSEVLLNRYLMYYFLSRAFITYQEHHLAGSVYIGLNIEMLSACPVPLPPIDEQVQIAEYLDTKVGDLNCLISKKEKLLEELEQYKKSLIYEYVTGKKEV